MMTGSIWLSLMKVKKKLLQEHFSVTTGKVVILKDIRNIQTGLVSKENGNNLDALVKKLRYVWYINIIIYILLHICELNFLGSSVEVFTNASNTFTDLLFQDNIMKFVFDLYPEVILVDSTYKLNNLRMLLYLMICIDGNGQGEIVLMFLTTLETEEAITKMVQTFKRINPKWECMS